MDDFNLIKAAFENQMNETAVAIRKLSNITKASLNTPKSARKPLNLQLIPRAQMNFQTRFNNRVFKVETASQAFLFKIFNSGWPEDGKLPFVDHVLTRHQIPHAKIYYYTHEDKNFPNGYLLEEYLPGTSADRLPMSDEETLALFRKLAGLVSQVHQIHMKGYGYTGSGEAEYTTFSEFMHDVLKDNAETLVNNGFISDKDLMEVNEAIYERLKACDLYPSVLCHGDLSIKNILVHSNEITLIDWDDAHSLCWVADLARLTFWMKLHYSADYAAACRRAFLENYQAPQDMHAFNKIEETLHVWHGFDFLTFFTEGPECEKVKRLLKDARIECGI